MTPLAIGGVIMSNLPGKQSTEWTVSYFLCFFVVLFCFGVYIHISTDHEETNSLWSLQEKSNELLFLIKSWDVHLWHDWKDCCAESCHRGGFYLQWPKTKIEKVT